MEMSFNRDEYGAEVDIALVYEVRLALEWIILEIKEQGPQSLFWDKSIYNHPLVKIVIRAPQRAFGIAQSRRDEMSSIVNQIIQLFSKLRNYGPR